jgi:hypothetical protein
MKDIETAGIKFYFRQKEKYGFRFRFADFQKSNGCSTTLFVDNRHTKIGQEMWKAGFLLRGKAARA